MSLEARSRKWKALTLNLLRKRLGQLVVFQTFAKGRETAISPPNRPQKNEVSLEARSR